MSIHTVRTGLSRLRPLLLLAFLSIGGTLAASAATMYLHVPFSPFMPLVCLGTIFGVYALNRYTDLKEDFANDSYTSVFFAQRRGLLHLVWGVLGAVVVFLALTERLGVYVMVLLLVGVFYSCKVVPWYRPTTGFGFIRLKEIPLMKNVLVAGFWGASIFAVPLVLSQHQPASAELIGAGVLATAMMLSTLNNTLFCDLLDVEGDRMVGNRTLPVLIGRTATLRIAAGYNLAWAATVILLAAYHVLDTAHIALLVVLAVYPLAYFIPYRRGWMRRQVLEFVCEGDLLMFAVGTAVVAFWG
ncbi:MAG: hypothetical protein GF331_14325 [Chitinivibrionales bacterium]|nr:hypothetical protein [Chitinivibrionales bacterium]